MLNALSNGWGRFKGWWREHWDWDWDYALAGMIITFAVAPVLTLFLVFGTLFAPPCSKDCDMQPVYTYYIPIPIPALHYPAGNYPNYDGPATGTYRHYYENGGGEEHGVRPGEEPQSPHEAPPEEHPVEPVEPHISEP